MGGRLRTRAVVMRVLKVSRVNVARPSCSVDQEAHPVQAVILLRFQAVPAQSRQTHRVNRVEQAVPVFRKGMQQGGDEHIPRDASYRV